MQNFATLQFKTRLGGEICSFDVNMHKGYYIAKLESYRRESTFFGYWIKFLLILQYLKNILSYL